MIQFAVHDQYFEFSESNNREIVVIQPSSAMQGLVTWNT